MNVLVVDTSSWISYFRNKNKNVAEIDVALKEGRVYLPSIVLSELLSGKLKPLEKKRLIDFLKELPLCLSDFGHWVRVGELRASLQSKGIAMSTPDAHVAQCAIDLAGYLMTEDQVFSKAAHHVPLRLLPE